MPSPEDFERLCIELLESNRLEDLATALYYRCATDLELFTVRYFAHYCKHAFNQFHRDYFAAVEFGERQVRRADGAPRGYAKSTLKALVKPIHDLVYGLEKYIVIFSNTESQALGKLKDIRTELLTNPRLVAAYRIRFQRKNVAEGSFVVNAGDFECKFEAYGTGAQIRGIRHGAARPTKFVLDDVEHSEEVENEAIRVKYEAWLEEDVLKAGDETTNVEFVGTVLHRKSLLKKLLSNPMYRSNCYKAVISWAEREDIWEQWRAVLMNLDNDNRLKDADAFYAANEVEMLKGTQVLWPEKEPYVALMKERIESGERSFDKEKQNDPRGSDEKIFRKFHWYHRTNTAQGPGYLIETYDKFVPEEEFKRWRRYAAMDPATGQVKARAGKRGDFTCILTGIHDPKERLWVHDDFTRRVPPTVYINQLIEQHLEWEYEKIAVETNLYRNLLVPNIRMATEERQKTEKKKRIRLPLYDVETVENKEKRIYTLEPKITNGWILLNRSLSQDFKDQLEDFPQVDHDDCPDTLEMLWSLVNGRYRMSAVPVDVMSGR